ncbi:MAG TPA: hypothetical protein PK961_02195 [bacterium]|nr:hypothetical protein [bacterium]
METQYLFDSKGKWIAYRKDRFVFSTRGVWIGWLPWDEPDVLDVDGDYLGTIYSDNRLVHFNCRPYRGYPGQPGYHGYPGYPGSPGFIGATPLPRGVSDIKALAR